MKKTHINIVHYMSKTANLEYGGELQLILLELVIAVVSVTLSVYGHLNQRDFLFAIFLVPAVLASIGLVISIYFYIDSRKTLRDKARTKK